MERWDYLVEVHSWGEHAAGGKFGWGVSRKGRWAPCTFEEALKRNGALGWELVTTTSNITGKPDRNGGHVKTSNYRLFYKRPLS